MSTYDMRRYKATGRDNSRWIAVVLGMGDQDGAFRKSDYSERAKRKASGPTITTWPSDNATAVITSLALRDPRICTAILSYGESRLFENTRRSRTGQRDRYQGVAVEAIDNRASATSSGRTFANTSMLTLEQSAVISSLNKRGLRLLEPTWVAY